MPSFSELWAEVGVSNPFEALVVVGIYLFVVLFMLLMAFIPVALAGMAGLWALATLKNWRDR